MKKSICILLACLTLLLCACAAQEQPPETVKTPADTTAAPETKAPATEPPRQETEAPTQAETEPVATEEESKALALAKTCIDKPVEELYALIGEPESTDYAPGCMGHEMEGNLYYDGFIVYTYVDSGEEIVYYVE